MNDPSYYLSEHAFFCHADNHYVVLDLRSDEYLCLGRTHTKLMRHLLTSRRLIDNPASSILVCENDDSELRSVVQALLKKGLLVENAELGKQPTSVIVDKPVASLMDGQGNFGRAIKLSDFWKLAIASITATINLRWWPIERTVRSVQLRKSTHVSDASSLDISVIAELFSVFQTLRPYYPRPYLCLFDSLALVHFLARYGVYPQWVYAVKLDPFEAHCWVQADDVVVNDTLENVRDFTPIMSI